MVLYLAVSGDFHTHTEKHMPKKRKQERKLYSAKGKKYLGFRSNSSWESGLFRMSNLAEAPLEVTWPQDVEGIPSFLWNKTCRYKTSEHAYQALFSKDALSARKFERGGIVNMKMFKQWPTKFDDKDGCTPIEVPLSKLSSFFIFLANKR